VVDIPKTLADSQQTVVKKQNVGAPSTES